MIDYICHIWIFWCHHESLLYALSWSLLSLSHVSHLKFFTISWTIEMWFWSWVCNANSLSQDSHWCLLSYALLPNDILEHEALGPFSEKMLLGMYHISSFLLHHEYFEHEALGPFSGKMLYYTNHIWSFLLFHGQIRHECSNWHWKKKLFHIDHICDL